MTPQMREDPLPPNIQHPEAAGFLNPCFSQFRLFDDLDAIKSLIREALPLLNLICLEVPQNSPKDWWFYGTNLVVGSIITTAWASSPLRFRLGQHSQLTVLLGYGGEHRVRQADRTWHCRKDGCLLLAGESCSLENSTSSALAFCISRDRLLQTVMSMEGRDGKPMGWNRLIMQSHGWQQPSDPAVPSLQAALRQLIASAVLLSGYSKALLERLQLDDQIYRHLAAMLLPELQQERNIDRLLHRQREGRDAFDELIDYLKENLSEPLNLTMMESRSHYSRRALQYAFLERMGCSATQWIRKQRLDLARQRLEHPKPGDTVGSIAIESGYRSLGLFSVDFQQRFHVKPSQLLRESRLTLPSSQAMTCCDKFHG
jgi:AraC-like DNA-binding protein